ncbi:sulfurtransferase-like selenium metabolism protein YedF [Campylobacter sp. MG1]|uniref:sulfurtransferase-like selenium metabolism protein YedF n=1 Tax=Campylobacter sp. MG1 TaxID=2976332 RepID=UPI00226CA535|nr:sulfurtransferase-like selenium metabolism protein YedF [Campylobacter sp. MG1]
MRLDFSGKACPIPVIETKKTLLSLENGEEVVIVVDNNAALENIKRLLTSLNQNYKNDGYVFTLTKSEIKAGDVDKKQSEGVFLKSQKIGDGELGGMLVIGFLTALKERKISKVVLVNDAIFIACDENHPAHNALKELQNIGVDIMCCANCLNYFSQSPKIGRSSNAVEIIDTLFDTKIISL